MSTLRNLLRNLRDSLLCVFEILAYALTFVSVLVLPKVALAGRLLAAESQLTVCARRIREKKDPRPRFTPGFRVLWVVLSKFLETWRSCAMRSLTTLRMATGLLAPRLLRQGHVVQCSRSSPIRPRALFSAPGVQVRFHE